MLMFFALMQCIAPIAHAHTDGHSVGYGVHLDLDTPNFSDSSIAHVSSVSATHAHSAIICMPPEHSSDKNCFPINNQHVTTLTVVDMAVMQIAIFHASPFIYQHHAYDRPFGQAPPL
ncbi:MAG TPA: hypothetical protein VFR06_08030 [Gallionellaceae bacterium]|nr:hypothetical protein [Gallionellaceae bacterium]